MTTFIKRIIPRALLPVTLLLLWVNLVGFSGSGAESREVDGGKGPTINVSFPLPNSNLAGERDRITLHVAVVAADGAKITQVLINNTSFSAYANAILPPDLPDGDSPVVQFDQTDPSR